MWDNMSVLTDLFKRRGIKDYTELSSEELVQYENWKAVLSKEEVTIADLREFCSSQLVIIDSQFKDLDRNISKTERLVLLHSVYTAILALIDSPQIERENLEKYLTSLL